VSQYFWPEEFRINDVALGLLDRGHRVSVLTGKPNYPSGKFTAGYGFLRKCRDRFGGAAVHRVPLVPRGSGSHWRLFLNYVSFALFAPLLAPFLCRSRYDAILVFQPSPVTVGIPALVMGLLARSPVLIWVQDLWPESLQATGAVRSPWMLRLAKGISRFIYRSCDLVLVQSKAFQAPLSAMGVERKRIRYFPNSAELIYRPIEPTSQDSASMAELPDGFRILFAGNIGYAQDFDTILAAAERLRYRSDVHWIVVGDGRRAQWLREQIHLRALGGTLHLLGRFPTQAMPFFFAAADVLLVSLKREPIFSLTVPSKLQSYLACGRPILAMLEGEGARIMKESAAGLTVPPEDADALARAALRIAAMPEHERRALGESGRRYFEQHFERTRLLEQLETWMLELRPRLSDRPL
jgi:glycosyltransferase involved in cell wall biosynthesis